MAGLLLFSCVPITNNDYGTLLITLPGNAGTSARAAVSGSFTATLTYDIECTGPGGTVAQKARPGSSVSLSLSPGTWTVTVTVRNAADQNIGSGSDTAVIEGGQITSVQIPVSIDTSGNDITSFAIISPESASGEINTNTNTIAVHVPAGTTLSAMNFTVTHTGVSISPASGPLDFSSPQSFTVTAGNGQAKTWTITVTADSTPPAGSGTWPSAAVLQSYGLAGLTQPAGTTVSLSGESGGALVVQLENAGVAAYNALVSTIEGRYSIGTDSSQPSFGIYVYDHTYTYSGESFALNIILDMSGMSLPAGAMVLTVTNQSGGGAYTWPDAGKWAAFNLSGLTQPAGTVIFDVSELTTPYLTLSVTLNNVGDTAYNALLSQIGTLLGAGPLSTIGSDGSPNREDVFMISGTNTIMVGLSMDTGIDEIIIAAVKM
jgi:hypothetical protein